MAQIKDEKVMKPWLYDLISWILSLLIDLFFREVHPRGAYKIPRSGPIIMVAAPHANQFVDSIILMRLLKREAKRRISWLIAEKSMRRGFIGTMAGGCGAVPVSRALDTQIPAKGKIFLPDQDNDPTLIQGVGTDFKDATFQIGGTIVLPKLRGQTPSTEISEIISATELRLKKPFKTPEALEMLTGAVSASGKSTPAGSTNGSADSKGTKFKICPFVDQSKVYDAVFRDLKLGGCVGIFPEGGSHDRTTLLPLKAGVAIMALGSLAQNPDSELRIIPVGMNYFHPNKFRSRAVIEFGPPIEVSKELLAAYKAGERRNAVASLLETVYQGLVSVTQNAPDYDTLMLIQAARRLYNPTGKKLPLSTVVELNRRLVKGYIEYQDDPRIIELKEAVKDYNKRLRALGIRDHQVEWATRPWWFILGTLLYRLGEILVLGIGTIPGLAMFWPVFVITKVISVRKSREALAASSVKLAGRDVIATWKLLVAIVIAPALYAYYTFIVTVWLHYNRHGGYYTHRVPWWMVARTYVPDVVPLWTFSLGFIALCTMTTFAALRIGEIGMDIIKSLPPLFVALNPRSSNSLVRLRQRRETLAAKVTDTINAFGPKVFPDFDASRIVADPFREGAYESRYKEFPDADIVEDGIEPATPTSATFGDNSQPSSPTIKSFASLLPGNEAFSNIASFGFFASQPATPKSEKSRSRSSSTGRGLFSGGLKPLSSLDNTKESLDEVAKRIRGAMKERGRKRESEGETGTESSWDMADSGAMTPKSEMDEETKKDK